MLIARTYARRLDEWLVIFALTAKAAARSTPLPS
jgi:hypothetical protein